MAPRILSIHDLETLSLDTIISKNRDRVQLGLATVEEHAALKAPIDAGRALTDRIREARFIALRLDGKVSTRLLGINQRTRDSWITSAIEQIDRDRVVTASGSVYAIASHGGGEPPLGHLLLLIRYLQDSGLGTMLGLPDVWYD